MNVRPYACAAEEAGNKPCIYEVLRCHWHLHNLFMRAVMESQLSSAAVVQVTKEERWGVGGENDNEDEAGGRKQQRKATETEWVRKDGEMRPVEGVTRDVLNSGRQTRKRTRNKEKKVSEIERRTAARQRERRKQKSGGKSESNYQENEESISINLYMSIPPSTSATRALHSAYQWFKCAITGIHNLYRQQGQQH